jgi:hypothetical protein
MERNDASGDGGIVASPPTPLHKVKRGWGEVHYLAVMKRTFLVACLLPTVLFAQPKTPVINTDVLVIGGGVGGTAAAIQSARMGVKTILVEETNMLGGMLTAAGVSCTDGNDQLPSGIWEEFRQALYKHYERARLNTGWVSNTSFEPFVGDSIFKAWAAKENNLTVYFNYRFVSVIKSGNKVIAGTFMNNDEQALHINAEVIIDGTELGDVFAKAGAAYDLGMDDPKISGEKEAREKNAIIQDLTWVAILKDYGAGADKTITRPANYDSTKYFCSTADAPCNGKPYQFDTKKVLDYGKLPRSPGAMHDKYMLNWPAHGNDYYLNVVENNYEFRVKNYELAKQQTFGFVHFLQTTLGMKHIGLADDELDGGMALIPYNREGRRVKGIVRLNINHLKNPYDYSLFKTGIAVGDYPVDHHHGQYNGDIPAIGFPKIPSFNIPLGCLIPEKIDGLIVCEKGISVTNIVNGSTRLQPVVLLTGQAAGVLAAKSIKEKKRVRDVTVRSVQQELLKLKCYLLPFVDVQPDDPYWGAIQRAGVTGILKGFGKSEGWANKMFFYPDSTVTDIYLKKELMEFENTFPTNYPVENKKLSIAQAWKMITDMQHFLRIRLGIPHKYPSVVANEWKRTFKIRLKEENVDGNRLVTKKELAVMIDDLAQNPFFQQIDLTGIRK